MTLYLRHWTQILHQKGWSEESLLSDERRFTGMKNIPIQSRRTTSSASLEKCRIRFMALLSFSTCHEHVTLSRIAKWLWGLWCIGNSRRAKWTYSNDTPNHPASMNEATPRRYHLNDSYPSDPMPILESCYHRWFRDGIKKSAV